MSVIPNLLVSGLVTVAVSVVFAVWCVGFVHRPLGGPVLIVLSVTLLLVGGGIVPPILGIVLGVAATRIGAASRRQPGRPLVALGRSWRWLTVAGIAGFLALFPGLVLLALVVDVDPSAIAPLALASVVLMLLALVAARARDRASAGSAAAEPGG